MKDFLGNDLKLGQEVAYMGAGGYMNAPSVLKKGIVVSLSAQENSVGIKNSDTNRKIARNGNQVVGGSSRSKEDFFPGENHNK